jgi:hypothetical protein
MGVLTNTKSTLLRRIAELLQLNHRKYI